MYERFYGFREKPFGLTPDPKFLFLGRTHRGAMEHLLYGMAQKEGFMVIAGEVGTGKTTLCRAFLERAGPQVVNALLLNPSLSEDELLRAILQEFGVDPDGLRRSTRLDMMNELNRFLLELASRGKRAVLIVDEAQALPLATLEQIRLLSNLETAEEKLLQIALVGQVELLEKLDTVALRQLRQRISIRYRIEPLGPREVPRYIEHRLRVAGAPAEVRFDRGALRAVSIRSRGIPRLVNLLCDRALLCGYEENSFHITRRMVERGARSLDGTGGRTRRARARGVGKLAWVAVPPMLVAVALAFYQMGLSDGALFKKGTLPSSSEFQPPPPVAKPPEPGRSPAPPREAEGNLPRPTQQAPEQRPFQHTIHLESFVAQERERAEREVRELRSRGYDAFLALVEIPQKGLWYRVLVGKFRGKREAKEVMERLKGQEGYPYAELLPYPEGR